MHVIREVWEANYEDEMNMIDFTLTLCRHPYIAIDTEFPGFLQTTPRFASEDRLYEDLKSNVKNTKLIQFGFTLFDADGNANGAWEVNFSNFGEIWDGRNEESIEFLVRNGVDLNKIREDGVDMDEFFFEFFYLLRVRGCKLTWVTFHGTYDLAYLVNILHGNLPETAREFAELVGKIFGHIYDLKYIAGKYEGLGHRLGLDKLAQKLGIQRIGTAHHAGSDSLLTAQTFLKMVKDFEGMKEAGGFIYGISTRVYPQSNDPQPWYNSGVAVSYPNVSCDCNDLVSHNTQVSHNDNGGLVSSNHQMCHNDNGGLVSYNPQMCHNNNGGLISYPQSKHDGFSQYDRGIFYNTSLSFYPLANYQGMFAYPSCGLAACKTTQTPNTVLTGYDNAIYVQ